MLFRASLSPIRIITLVAIFAVGLAIVATNLALLAPQTGVQYQTTVLNTEQQKQGLIIASVASNSVAEKAGLSADINIVAISSAHNNNAPSWFDLEANDFIEEPDLLPDYTVYERFFERQKSIYTILQSERYLLKDSSGTIYQLNTVARSLANLPFIYWFQVLCGLIAVVTGISVYAFRRDDPASLQYAINGASFLIITLAASIYSSRELAINADLFYALNMLNHFASMVFSASFMSLFFLYPQRLSKFPWHWLFMAIFITNFILETTGFYSNHDESMRIPIMLALASSVILAVMQRYKNRHQIIQKAALRWFVFSLLLGGSLFVGITIVMSFLGIHSEIAQGYSLGFILIMYLGIALGITRYRLFQLESWWLSIWLWILGGVILLSFDALLTYALQLNQSASLGLSLALVGWLYFPLRQWVAKKVFHRNSIKIEDLFPDILTLLLSSNQKNTMSQHWLNLLQKTFQPMQIRCEQTALNFVSLSATGNRIKIPSVNESEVVVLDFADKGKRLFNDRDYQLASALWALLQHALIEKNAFEKGTQEERKRISRDLHDDIGTRLLTLIHKTEEPSLALLAKDAMRDLRLVLTSLDDRPKIVNDALGDWRGETEQRCQLVDVNLEWKHNEVAEDTYLSTRQFINIQRVLREIVTNALKHSKPKVIKIEFNLSNHIDLVIKHDGCTSQIDAWKRGRGLNNIDHRVSELSGSIKRTQDEQVVTTTIKIALD